MEKKKIKLNNSENIIHVRVDLTTDFGKRIKQISKSREWKPQFTVIELAKMQVKILDGEK